MKIRHLFRRALAALGLAVASIAATPAVGQTARPALWKVSDPDTTIYLFGTIHLLPPGLNWQSQAVDSAIASSRELVVEVLIDEKNPMPAVMTMMSLGTSPNLPPLAQRVPAKKRARLAELIKQSGRPAAEFDRLETWLAGIMLFQLQFPELGLDPKSGVELNLKSVFSGANKPIGQLETPAEQFGFFDRLPEKSQRSFLEGVLDEPKNAKGLLDKMIASWASGDTRSMGAVFNGELKKDRALKAALLDQRNANWTRWIEDRLGQPGTVMVAVGAGHLVGDTSVVRLLEKRGFKVTRIQ
jgi:uncharacterized protein